MRIAAALLSLCLLLYPVAGQGTVIFTDNFDSWDDWTVTQLVGSDTACTSSCGIGSWDMYRNQGNLCDVDEPPPVVTGTPGNYNAYIDQYAGYPDETNTCYGGSGKCFTHWLEACLTYPDFDASDMLFVKRLGADYDDIYVRFYVRFKTNYEFHPDTNAFKFWHMWYYKDGDSVWDFHHSNVNTPIAAGGINGYSTSVYIYMDGICTNTLSCHNDIIFPIATTSNMYDSGYIFDGGWHKIIIRVKTNSAVGTADGLIEAWLDGTKLSYLSGYEGDDIEFNDDGAVEPSPVRGWNSISVGGNNTSFLTSGAACTTDMADCEQWYAIDNVKVTTTYAEANADDEDTTAPLVSSVVIQSGGTSVIVTLNESTTIGAGGNGGLTFNMSGGSVTASYSSGSGTTALTYSLSRTIYSTETGTYSYTQPGNGWEDAAGNDVETVSSESVTNESTQSEPPAANPSISGIALSGCVVNGP